MDVTLKLVSEQGGAVTQEYVISPKGAILGRGRSADISVHDPAMAARHCEIKSEDGQWVIASLHADSDTFVNEQKITKSPLKPGDVIRVGTAKFTVARTELQVAGAAGASSGGFIANFMDRVTSLAGLEAIKGFSVGDMLSEIFKKRTESETENYLIVGTDSTTPDLKAVDLGWPKPWLFFKTLALLAVVYLGFALAFHLFNNANLIPGLIIMGSVAAPLSLMVFFYEVNVARNVSIYQVARLLILGSIVSLFLTMLGYQITSMDEWLGPVGVAILEESGKAATLLLVVNKLRYRWTLNGLLFGAIVGTGFAVFESAGYAQNFGQAGFKSMLDVIDVRGALTVFGGHVLWTAIVGAALWRVRGADRFNFGMLKDGRFLRAFAFAVAMHAVWDSPKIPDSYWIKYIVLGLVAWALVLGYIQSGLKQLREAAGRA